MSKKTLDAMWRAVQRNKHPFIDYLQQKAKLFGMEKLGWQDVDAPVAIGNVEPTTFTYDEACDFVIEHFSSFGKNLSEFSIHALYNRCVVVGDRMSMRSDRYCANIT